MTTITRFASWLVPLSLIVAASGAARAQTPDAGALAAAQTLYDDATKAMERRDYAAACPKLEEVVRLVPEGLGAKLSLAECYEGAGRTASAWSMYLVVAEVAGKTRQESRRLLAEGRAAALKPKLSQLVIAVPPALRSAPGLEIRRDDAVVGMPQWGLPVPVDRGQHTIVVAATGKRPWKKIVQVEGEGAVVTVEIEPLADEAPVAPPQAVPPAPPPPPPLPPPVMIPPKPPPFWSGQRIAGAVIAGVGLVGLGVGTEFGVRAISTKGEAGCDGNVCPDHKSIGLFKDARTQANMSTVFFVAGGVVLAGGAVVFLTAPSSPKAPSTAVAIEAGSRGIHLCGTW